ncbi:hypothetical protein HAV15_004819 [Penicillium sp. str. |nr:hypothetical protein HAV15_004819 [Penicillium sp. str. \
MKSGSVGTVTNLTSTGGSQRIHRYPKAGLVCLAGFAALAFIITFFKKEIKLRTELETEYGIKDPKEGMEKETGAKV